LGGGASSISVAATSALACVDGDLATSQQFTEGAYVKMTSTDGTIRVYVLTDSAELPAIATGTVIASGGDTGAGTLSSVTAALGTCISVSVPINWTDNAATQAAVLNEIRTAVLHANGHNGKFTASAALTPANGAQTITFTQAEKGTTGNKTTSVSTKIPDLTAVDLGIGVTDEDITYMGSKTVLKTEIKKETTISLTRKKSDNVWDIVYNGPTATNEGWNGAADTGDYGARWGVIEGAADTWYINSGQMAPKDVTDFGGTDLSFGYRVHIELKNGEEVISIPACQLVGHTVSLNADGTTEETCELVSQVTPKIGTAPNYDRITATQI
jgi:hypothetical protein